jgi:hypothetical protein
VYVPFGLLKKDRRDFGFLGALLLGWALVAAPVVHQVFEHAAAPEQLGTARALPLHRPSHSHGPAAPGAQHGEGSLEHGKAFFSSPPAAPQLVVLAVSLAAVALIAPPPVDLEPVARTAQPQGP